MDLVADIGATNARFQFSEAQQLKGEAVVLATADYDSTATLLEEARARLPSEPVDRALLAVAGPARQPQRIEVTNTGLVLEQQTAGSVLGCEVRLVNDFFALAHGVPHFKALEQLGGDVPQRANKALLGPGSGLGMATLLPPLSADERYWRVVGSEGGHADLPPGSPLEAELWAILARRHGHVCWESVLSGPGLQNLYAAMCEIWGMRPAVLTPAQISAQGCDMSDAVCHQTLETFCAWLGAAAGNLALTVTAVGGVYIGGGVIGHMLDFVRASALRRRFEERGAMTDMIQRVPLLLITEADPGLLGAAHCLAAPPAT